MSEATTHVSAREAILREQQAFVDGAVHGAMHSGRALDQYRSAAEHRYPLPKVTRPRVVPDPHGGSALEWSVRTDDTGKSRIAVQRRHDPGGFRTSFDGIYVTAERVALWADLLANPTEQVEA